MPAERPPCPDAFGSPRGASSEDPRLLVSPELALVDPELRSLAIALLPEPGPAQPQSPAPHVPLQFSQAEEVLAARDEHVGLSNRLRSRPRAFLALGMAIALAAGGYAARSGQSGDGPFLAAPRAALAEPAALGGREPRSAEPATSADEPAPRAPVRTLPRDARQSNETPGQAPPGDGGPKSAPVAPPEREAPARDRPATAAPAKRVAARGPQAARSIPPGCVTIRWAPVEGADFYNVVLWRGNLRVLDLFPTETAAQLSPEAELSAGALVQGAYRWVVYPAFGPRESPRFAKAVAAGTLTIPPGYDERRC